MKWFTTGTQMGALPSGGIPGVIPRGAINRGTAEVIITEMMKKKSLFGAPKYPTREAAEKAFIGMMKRERLTLGTGISAQEEKANVASLIGGDDASFHMRSLGPLEKFTLWAIGGFIFATVVIPKK